MNKTHLVVGIIFLFIFSSIPQIVLGFDVEKVDVSMQSADGSMDYAWPMKCHDTKHTGRSPYSTANNPMFEKWRFRCGRVEGGAVIDKEEFPT